jgi:hypothetical protein
MDRTYSLYIEEALRERRKKKSVVLAIPLNPNPKRKELQYDVLTRWAVKEGSSCSHRFEHTLSEFHRMFRTWNT